MGDPTVSRESSRSLEELPPLEEAALPQIPAPAGCPGPPEKTRPRPGSLPPLEEATPPQAQGGEAGPPSLAEGAALPQASAPAREDEAGCPPEKNLAPARGEESPKKIGHGPGPDRSELAQGVAEDVTQRLLGLVRQTMHEQHAELKAALPAALAQALATMSLDPEVPASLPEMLPQRSGPRIDSTSEMPSSLPEVVTQRSGPRIDSPSGEGGTWAQMASPRDAPRVFKQKSGPAMVRARSLGLISYCSGSSGSGHAKATSVGGLKSQLADQLLRYHRLLPDEDPSASTPRSLARLPSNTSLGSQRGDLFSTVPVDGACAREPGRHQSLRTLVNTVGSTLADFNPRSEANQNEVEELRHRRVSELTSHFSSASSNSVTARRVPALGLLWIFGVLPPPSRRGRWSAAALYQPFVCILVTLACFEMVASSLKMDASRGLQQFEHGVQAGLLSDMALAAGSLVGLLLVGAPFGSRTLSECIQLLLSMSAADEMQSKLGKRTRRELVGLVLIWGAAMTRRVLDPALSPHDLFSWKVLHVLSFALVSGVLLSLALTMICVCHGLAIMIDTFCIHISEREPHLITMAVQEWNVLQAVLRKASSSIEYCFFTLQTAAWFAVLFGYIDVAHGSDSLVVPCGMVLLGLSRIFYCAAAITDKCAQVPSLVNSLYFGQDVDIQRQYVVQFIMQSGAGFYVLGVRMDSAVTLKLAYVCGIVSLGLMHRVLQFSF